MAYRTNAQTIIAASLKLIGVLAQGESPSAPVLQDSFARLNSLIDSWGTQRLTMIATGREVFNLVANQAAYTLGTGGNWNMARPTSIDGINLLLTDTSPVTEIPLVPLTEQAWRAQPVKALENALPTQFWVEWTAPLATVTLWPVPDNATHDVVVYAPVATVQFSSYVAFYDLPDGYERTIRYNLAVELAPEMGVPTPGQVAVIARESLQQMKANNTPMVDLSLDGALTHAADGAGILMIEDGIFGALKGTAVTGKIEKALSGNLKVYVLGPDLKARGMTDDQVIDGVKVVDYAGFVDLVTDYDKVQAWL